MRKAAVELIGTFFLVLVIGLTVTAPGAGALAPLAIGAVLIAMIYAGGPISGAHYNPAVTLAVWLRGKCDTQDVPPYIGAQILGAVLAATALRFCKPHRVANPMVLDVVPALLVELLFTFALAFVVLQVATSKKSAGNHYFGLAIGLTVLAGAYAAGSITGGVFNPAVAIGISWMGLSSWSDLWVFLAANFAGGALAAYAFRFINAEKS